MTDLFTSDSELSVSVSPSGRLAYQNTLTTVCTENLCAIILYTPSYGTTGFPAPETRKIGFEAVYLAVRENGDLLAVGKNFIALQA